MSRHSLGPWQRKVTKSATKGHPTQTHINSKNWEALAVVYGTSDGTPEQLEEAEANARLIAAAPELLEACRHVLRHWVGKPDCNFDIAPVIAAVDRAVSGASSQDSEQFAERIKSLDGMTCMFVSDIDG